jgi:tRNA A-37 threonylcarbamoyl transferase component Bud32
MVPHIPSPGNVPLPHSQPVAAGRASAAAAPAVAGPLRELLAHDVGRWPEFGLRCAKQRTVRSVFRGELGGVPVFVKVFRADTLIDRVRDLVRADRGRAECRHLAAAAGLGLPVVEPLAHGFAVEGDHLRSFVVTRAAPGAPFDFGADAGAQRRTGVLLRRLHDLGVLVADLHPGNVLIDDVGAPRLLDLTSVRHGEPASAPDRARGLARFCNVLDGGALDPAAAALFAGYLAAGALPATFPGEVAAAARRLRASSLHAFGRRAFRDCAHTETTPRRRATPRWVWHLPTADATVRAACAAFADAPGAPTKSGRRGAVWLHGDLAVKERDAGAARKLWRASYWLAYAGVDAPPPVALRLHAGRGLVCVRRVGAGSLADELAAAPPSPAAAVADAARLGRSVGRLHAHGLGNRDLKFSNLVRDPASGALAMVDLDGVRRRAATETRGRGADLGRLLAAFDAAGRPGGERAVRAFLRGYARAHRDLLQATPLRRLLRRAMARAGEWRAAHAGQRPAATARDGGMAVAPKPASQ